MPALKFITRLGWRAYIALVFEIALDRLHLMWCRTETRSAEITYGLIALGWAVLLFQADSFAARHLSAYLEQIAPPVIWQWVLLFLAFGQLTLACFRQRTLVITRAAIWLLSFGWWTYMSSISVSEVPPALFSAVTFSVLAFGSFWAVTRTLER